MDAVFLEKRHEKLLRVAQLVRHHQRRYFTFKTSVDLDKAKYYERQLDQVIKEEEQIKNSPQKELF